MWYGVEDVMTLLGVKQSKAYQVIRKLADEIAKTKIPGKDRCYERPPASRIQKSYFCEKYMFNIEECDKILSMKGATVRV